MALAVGVDSYASIEEADRWFAGRFFAETSAWEDATADEREAALVEATRRLDRLSFVGRKKDPLQALEFPRCYASYVEGEPALVCDADVLPNVKRAVFEEALALLSGAESSDSARRARLQADGVTSVKIGSTSESYSGAGARFAALASREAADYIKPYLASTAAFG